MLDGLHAPCCPYCGGVMSITIKKLKNMTIYWYECDNCMSSSPAASTEKGAYLQAMRRKETPNCVLTLVEACAKEFCWTEERRINAIEDRRLALRDWASILMGNPRKQSTFSCSAKNAPTPTG